LTLETAHRHSCVVDLEQWAMRPDYSWPALSVAHRRCCFSPALDGSTFAFGLRSDLLAEIVADGDPDVLPFPMNADLAMVSVEFYGALSHDCDCKARSPRVSSAH
jgi:hypothetical protein